MMKQTKTSDVICPHCYHVYAGHTNNYGKACMHCLNLIPPEQEPLMVSRQKALNQWAKEVVEQVVREKIQLGR
jgi:hypothetical protein